MKKSFLLLIILGVASCSVINPQPTPTQIPTTAPTQIPTPTINPCSDKGWTDISTYVDQFNRAAIDIHVGDSIATQLERLKNIKDKVNEVSIDACSEYARQTIITSLNDSISSFYSIFTNDIKNGGDLMIKGVSELTKAEEELRTLGIMVNLK
jgi:hypothetical protein